MAAVPLVLCGKSPMMAKSFIAGLDGADYKVIHACHTLETALLEIPALLRGESITPASDLSTVSATNTVSIPKAVVIGKGFSSDEMHEIIRAGDADAKGRVAWLLPDDDKFTAYMKAKALLSVGTLLPTVIADRVKICLGEHGLRAGSDDVKGGGVWEF
ncbi:hypothetical protein AAFC00_001917 [Neodothiora populina]|uniref:Uncharacterized protein n=1 Tax=Neodothiora populina TaxID=2781224 RepID=A0ABR3PQZ1_9PEZI